MIWKYFSLLTAIALVSPLPRRVGYFIARIVADLIFLNSRKAKAGVIENLRHVLGPDVDDDELNRLALEAFRNASRNTFDLINLPRRDPSTLEKPVTVHGWEHMDSAIARGKGVVLASIHMGNMDMSIQIIRARGVNVTILAEVEEPEQLYRKTSSLRSFNGISILPVTYSGIKIAMKKLRKGELVAIACDRALQGSGQYRPFFGKEALLPIGGVEMAYRTGAAILPAFTFREKDYKFTMHFEAPILLDREAGRELCIESGLSKIITLMEQYISRHPEQWMVFEPIWREETSIPLKTASLTSGRRALNGVGHRTVSSNGSRTGASKASTPSAKP